MPEVTTPEEKKPTGFTRKKKGEDGKRQESARIAEKHNLSRAKLDARYAGTRTGPTTCAEALRGGPQGTWHWGKKDEGFCYSAAQITTTQGTKGKQIYGGP